MSKAGVALLGALSLVIGACRTQAPETALTEVLVQIFADEQVQQAGDTLIVEVASGPKTQSELSAGDPETFNLSGADFRWPATMALVAKASHEDYVFELNLRLENQGEIIARGRVRSGFVRGQTLVLQTFLSAECLGKLDCPAGQTCVVNNGRAACEDAAVDSGSLPHVDDAPKSNDAGTATIDAGKPYMGKMDAAMPPSDAGVDAATDSGNPNPPGCIPSSAEICDNGIDDDCNGNVDCADSACEAITLCVPNPSAYALVGADQDCPEGYAFRDLIYRDLRDPGCRGCSCQAVPKECAAYVSIYDNADACSKDSQPYSGGTTLQEPATSSCSLAIGKQIDLASGGYGFRVTVKASADACTVVGEAKALAPFWTVSLKRCSAQLRRSGCPFGSYCAHTRNVPVLCRAGSTSSCEPGESQRLFYASYDDKRSCEACTCEAKNGSCADVGAAVTTDPSCQLLTTTLHDGQKSCQSISSEASVRSVGKPRDPSCTSDSLETGSVTPSGPVILCCNN